MLEWCSAQLSEPLTLLSIGFLVQVNLNLDVLLLLSGFTEDLVFGMLFRHSLVSSCVFELDEWSTVHNLVLFI